MGSKIWSLLLGFLALQFCILLAQGCRCSNSSAPDLSLGGRGLMGRLAKQLGLSQQQANNMLAARAYPGLGDSTDPPPSNPPGGDQPPPRRRGWWGRRWGGRWNQPQNQPQNQQPDKKPDLSGMNMENYEKLLAKYGVAPDPGTKAGSRRRRRR